MFKYYISKDYRRTYD
jgi:hypothetical protein